MIVVVTVGVDGTARDVQVVSDPGYGLGEAARQCALRAGYVPELDPGGLSVEGKTAPIRIRFPR